MLLTAKIIRHTSKVIRGTTVLLKLLHISSVCCLICHM